MIGHFILNGIYKGKLHRVSQKHFNDSGDITHVTVFPVSGTVDEIVNGTVKISVDQIDLHQAA